jgi:hypothetical protein
MPDFPAIGGYLRVPSAISWCGDTVFGDLMRIAAVNPGTSAWTTANTAVFLPFTISFPYLAQKMAVQVATQSGNMDIGIYDEKGNRLVSMGSTAVGAAGLQVFDITDTWLNPGTYFMAVNADNVAAFLGPTTTILAANHGRTSGLQQQAVGAVTLPNPATFATFTARNVPFVTISGATL